MLQRLELLRGVARHAVGERREVNRGRRRDQHGLAFEGAAKRGEVGLGLEVHNHRVGHLPPVGARGVRDGVGHHGRIVGRQHVQRDVLVVPRDAEIHVRFAGYVRESHAGHAAQHPALRALHVGGHGEARAEDVGDVALELHDLRMLEAFLADFGDHDPVHAGGGGERDGDEGEEGEGERLEGEWHTRARRREQRRASRLCYATRRQHARRRAGGRSLRPGSVPTALRLWRLGTGTRGAWPGVAGLRD